MSTGLPSQIFNLAEPIPGYRVQERIGVGGYGEVWKAEAPGGIAKAIKVVYGYHDDERASRELSALNRIKEVRHPFLLSLERIELVEGHLVIVTELATSSMKNLFEQHVRSGEFGIPRPELLQHLRDAADALDYIFEKYSLQHLDVKPENLLLVGGRVKVADFGLVKDLQDVNCSNMGGLTPVYAAPELFDGRPTDHSDQYSLAIVYQELLTGTLPFQGRTTAQLASQHMHSPPLLDRLPLSDQATIARALSKNPKQRFSSCREMVDRLLEATPTDPTSSPGVARRAHAPFPAPAPNKTEVLAGPGTPVSSTASRVPDLSQTQLPEPEPTICDLPPFELKAEDVQYRPTIIVGVGGVAVRTLRALQQRLVDRFGDLREVPALQLLAFDTDAETLKEVTEGDGQTSLSNDSVILLPLRQPADYRGESAKHLLWLSRRWIFNIPRSQQTQGFRPLGRLALVDHIERVVDRLTRSIKAAVTPEGLAVSSQKTGLPFTSGAPRVFIVSSISGGTGSGMVLDVGYLVRKILRELNLSEAGVCGLLVHCTGRDPQARDLAIANSYAFLGELNHYSDVHNAYPGDRACGLPAFAVEDAPFNNAYVVHVGDDLEKAEFVAATHKLAHYLFWNTVTSAGAFFDKCRAPGQLDRSIASGSPTVRTFGLCELGLTFDDVPAAAVDDLCRALLSRWRGSDRADADDQPTSLSDLNSLLADPFAAGLSDEELRADVAVKTADLDLKVDSIVAQLYHKAIREMGSEPEPYLQTVLEELVNKNGPERRSAKDIPAMDVVLDALETILSSQRERDAWRVCLESVLEEHLKQMADATSPAVRQWILGLVAQPIYRVKGAQRVAEHVGEHLRTLTFEASEAMKAVRRKIISLEGTLRSEVVPAKRASFFGVKFRRKLVVDKRLLQYFRLRIDELTLNGVCRFSGLILTEVATLNDTLRNLAADLNRLAEGCSKSSQSIAGEQPGIHGSDAIRRVIAETISEHKTELVSDMERQLEPELTRVITSDLHGLRRMPHHVLRRAARSAILRALKQFGPGTMLDSADANPLEPVLATDAGLKAAMPRLLDCGGSRRLLLVAPADFSSAPLLEQLDGTQVPPTVVVSTEDDVLLCYELEQLSLRRVAAAVLARRFQNVEVAARLHTRIDVSWSPF